MQSRIEGHISHVVAVSLRRMNRRITIAKSVVRDILKNPEVLEYLEMSHLKLTDETSQNKCAAESEKTCITLQSGMSQQFPTTPIPKKAEMLWKKWIKTRMWSIEKELCWQSPRSHVETSLCHHVHNKVESMHEQVHTCCWTKPRASNSVYMLPGSLYPTHRLYKDGQHESSHKVRPEHVDCPLVVGCGIGHKPLLNYIRWALGQTKTKYSSSIFFSNMVCVILSSSYHIGICSSVPFSDNFSANYLFNAIKTWGKCLQW